MNSRLTTAKILSCLAKRHRQDIFLNEVGNGPTGNGYRRMDAVAMKKSWSNPSIIVYEIKASRSDFLSDNKWHEYLKYCNQLSFAVAEDVCDKSELPDEVGLVQYNAARDTIRTVRKPVWRPIDAPVKLYEVMLMRLSHNVGDYGRILKDDPSWYQQRVEEYIADKNYRQKLSNIFRSKVVRERDDAMRCAYDAERIAEEASESVEALNMINRDLHNIGIYSHSVPSTIAANVHKLIYKKHPDIIETKLTNAAKEIATALEFIKNNSSK